MKIAVIGTGYVGLVSGTCFAELGHNVVCVDTDQDKIESLKNGVVPIYEPGLSELVKQNARAERLLFTTNLADALQGAETVFIAVGTPSLPETGAADLQYVYAAAKEIAETLQHDILVIIKSTVPVGTNRAINSYMQELRPDLKLNFAFNPEFLREGQAIGDFMKPDRIVCGVNEEDSVATIREIYRPMHRSGTHIMFTDVESSEILKYGSNAFLATKITFINELAELCEKVGGDVRAVAEGIGLDSRIGSKFLNAGPGYGGSCFPKDTAALALTGRDLGVPMAITETVIQRNTEIKARMAQKILSAQDGKGAGQRIAVLGVTFKPDTDDMRDAPSLVIIPELQKAGASIVLHDPQQDRVTPYFSDVDWASSPYEAAQDADIVVLLTEWNVYRGLDLSALQDAMRGATLIDLRNIYSVEQARNAGFTMYSAIGRQPVYM